MLKKIPMVVARPILIQFLCLVFVGSSWADTGIETSKGQTVYVPLYSHVYAADNERPFQISATVSVRNTDMEDSITLIVVDYYDNDGKLLHTYVEKPVTIKPLGSVHYKIKESDRAGGFGANFIIKWESKTVVNAPIIESVMISTRMAQGISFVSRGKVIKEK